VDLPASHFLRDLRTDRLFIHSRDAQGTSAQTTAASGDVGERREGLVDFILAQGIALEFQESIAPALGMSYGGKIVVLPGQSPAEEFSTLVHELAHLCWLKVMLRYRWRSAHLLARTLREHNIISDNITSLSLNPGQGETIADDGFSTSERTWSRRRSYVVPAVQIM